MQVQTQMHCTLTIIDIFALSMSVDALHRVSVRLVPQRSLR